MLPSQIPPLLVDATRGAKILGVSVSHFYVFMRRNAAVQPITISSTNMWRRKDILRFTSKADESPIPEDFLVDAQEVAALCSISLSMVYKLKRLGLMPTPFRDGRTSKWSFQEIEKWVDAGCPNAEQQATAKRKEKK